jgi:hypothetical protein
LLWCSLVNPSLAASEIVATVALTRMPSVDPGERSTTTLARAALDRVTVRFT